MHGTKHWPRDGVGMGLGKGIRMGLRLELANETEKGAGHGAGQWDVHETQTRHEGFNEFMIGKPC